MNPSNDSAPASPMLIYADGRACVCASSKPSPSAGLAIPSKKVKTPVRKTRSDQVVVRPVRFRDN